MMNDQDRDLIAALVEGSLSGIAAERAVTRIEADPELASEYAAQLTALAFLQSGAVPQMTSLEREALHTNLTQRLGLTRDIKAHVRRKRGIPRWQPALGLAIAATAVAAIVILPSPLTVGSTDSAETVISAERERLNEETATEPFSFAQQQDVDSTGRLSTEESTIAIYDTDAVDLADLLERTKGAAGPNDISSKLSSLQFTRRATVNMEAITMCLDQIEPVLPPGIHKILPLGAEEANGSTIVHFGFDFGSGIDTGVSIDMTSCEIVDANF